MICLMSWLGLEWSCTDWLIWSWWSLSELLLNFLIFMFVGSISWGGGGDEVLKILAYFTIGCSWELKRWEMALDRKARDLCVYSALLSELIGGEGRNLFKYSVEISALSLIKININYSRIYLLMTVNAYRSFNFFMASPLALLTIR